jgi:hypothetical protein
VNDVIAVPLSILIEIVSGLTPESASETVKLIVGLLLVSVAPDVGAVILIVGATVSLTTN